MGGAIGTAGFFNMLLGNADIVPISDMTGIVEFAGIWKKRGRVYAAPSYYAFQMYSSAQVDRPVAVQTDSPVYNVTKGITRLPDIPNVAYLDVVAALNRSGDRLTLFCVNRHLDRDLPAVISIDGFTPAADAAVETLFSNSIYDVNDEMRPEAVTPKREIAAVHGSQLNFTFRHESVTRIELRKN
jgi:alpha-N-arabinofuranosidase